MVASFYYFWKWYVELNQTDTGRDGNDNGAEVVTEPLFEMRIVTDPRNFTAETSKTLNSLPRTDLVDSPLDKSK